MGGDTGWRVGNTVKKMTGSKEQTFTKTIRKRYLQSLTCAVVV